MCDLKFGKNIKPFGISLFFILFVSACSQNNYYIVAFGSCASQDNPLSIFDVVVKHEPDLFIFLGDNIYGDTEDMDVLKAKYTQLENKPSFQNLKNNVDIIATWDDHDYGKNDAGRHYRFKSESKEIFLDFFQEPADSNRRKHDGIYHSIIYPINGGFLLQVILLDTRTFRDDLRLYSGAFDKKKKYFYKMDYAQHQDSSVTFLGDLQWKWLEEELSKPADLRLIVSSTQFGIEYNGYEAWANFPHEQYRLLELIRKTRADGVMFLSGDVHYAEISKMSEADLYPLYDITSSGLSRTWRFATPNKNRIEGPVMTNNFGLLTIDTSKKDPAVKIEIWDVNDNQRVEYTIPLTEISFNN